MNLKSKLNRFKSHISTKDTNVNRIVESEIDIPFIEIWEQESVSPYYFENQFCLIRKVNYPISYRHGSYSLSDFAKAVSLWNESDLNHPLSAKGFKANELFFFDTETTGLGGGVGNTIFILGHAALLDNEIILTQHILPNPGSEVPLYYSFLNEVDYRTLVTYNGKSFDWPQVKTRHTLIRDHVPKLPEFGHFDLYHAAKRIWKHKLDRMNLATVEKEVLGVTRVDDVPGYLAPMIYFDFVERKDPEGMIKILKHNEIDILSLITLYSHLTFQLLGTDRDQSVREKYEIGRWLSSLGEDSEAKYIYHSIENLDDSISIDTKLRLGYIYKKKLDFHKSLDYFFKVLNHAGFPDIQLEACVEAAKILEHQLKNYKKAVSICDIALGLINQGCVHRKITIIDIEKRKDRIIKKNNFLGKRKIHEISSN